MSNFLGAVTGTFSEENDDPLDPDSFSGGGIRVVEGGGGEINNSVIQRNRTLWDGITDEATINGAGIDNRGQLEINNTTIIDNISDVNAGGIYNTGTLEVFDSSIINNSANVTVFYVDQVEGGGGIQNSEDGTLLIKNSTIAGNTATLSGNDNVIFPEGTGGGGILSDGGEVVILNSTIVDNSAPLGAGILIDEPTLDEVTVIPATLQNSIVAGNTNIVDSPTNFSADIEGLFDLNSSYNLIGNGNGILFDEVENNIVGDPFNPLDPQLTPLQFNGGLTPTYAPLQGSPVINAGSNALASQRTLNTAPLTEDQTGKPRIIDARVDIGSVEYDPAENIASGTSSSVLNSPIYRFQNSTIPGTYLYANSQERQSILNQHPEFIEEGFAFNVAVSPGDDLIAMYRFQNSAIPGTYLYASEGERIDILNDYLNFVEEGLAFYVTVQMLIEERIFSVFKIMIYLVLIYSSMVRKDRIFSMVTLILPKKEWLLKFKY